MSGKKPAGKAPCCKPPCSKAPFKSKISLILVLFALNAAVAGAQTDSSTQTEAESDSDLDDVFNTEKDVIVAPGDAQQTQDGNQKPKNPVDSLIADIFGKAGYSFNVNYNLTFFYFPGWDKVPGESGFDIRDINYKKFAVNMSGSFGFDFRLSPVLRVWQSLSYSLISGISFDEFYFDYNLLNRAFFKVGKYSYKWGASPNFPYTDLLSRVPIDIKTPGDEYFFQLNVPINIGVAQLISFTRTGFIGDIGNLTQDGADISMFALGGKLSFSFPFMDIDLGTLYFAQMPWRSIISLKKTLFASTECYAEGLVSVPIKNNPDEKQGPTTGSFSFGFYQDFYHEKIRLNAEVFFNYEFDTLTYYNKDDPVSSSTEVQESFPFIPGINTALTLTYKPGGLSGLNLALKFVYSFVGNIHGSDITDENGNKILSGGQIIPGFSIEPAQNLKIYFGIPIVVGGPESAYYKNNVLDSRLNNMPFGFALLISVSGSYKVSHY